MYFRKVYEDELYEQVVFVRLCEHRNDSSGYCVRLLAFVPLQIDTKWEILNT
jgi:hypothetical protein